MRILQLISSEGRYGAETMLLGLAKCLTSLGHETLLGVFRNSHQPHTEIAEAAGLEGLPVEIIPCNGRVDLNAVRAIQRCITTHSMDVVHTHGYKTNLYGYAAARRYGTPLVATYHIDWPDRGVALRLYHLLDRVVVRRFEKVVAVSDAVASSLRRSGLPQRKVTTIDNAIELAPFRAPKPTLREEMPNQATMLVGLVGRLTPQKGGEYFLRTAAALLGEFPDVRFVLVGEGPERKRLEQLAQELGIAAQVGFLGRREDMPGVYASLDVLVLPSINEGLPMTILEALATGTPVVATAVGAVPKLIVPGRTGLLVEPRDTAGLRAAVARLLTDAKLRKELGENGRAWVRQGFSSAAMADKYLDLYRQVLQTHASAQSTQASSPMGSIGPSGS